MIPLHLDQLTRVLCLGAHPDDIEIGCGGTILDLVARRPSLEVHWVVLSGDAQRREEAIQSGERFLEGAAQKQVLVEKFRDSFFPYEGPAIKEYFHGLRQQLDPDVIFTHRREDMHQDHRLVAELTWNAFRNHLILEYEIPKYEGDLGTPNVFSALAEETCFAKIDMLVDCFPSQHARPWFSRETFWALLRLRGLECQSPSGCAEGLYCRKAVLSAAPAAPNQAAALHDLCHALPG
jgi:LmbE family N-acetylglucosaminyl deacetylase